ncbi:MAG TPA: hypothetical protein PL059_09800 [Spirochaetota bacterium]|nr:hypothetical protein [Spirochaetota bacterium]HOM10278.1 hypothetical protein [Spirochaetota bacterium]HPP50121.1 hypothetical protein [Spirochaetota bacterium]
MEKDKTSGNSEKIMKDNLSRALFALQMYMNRFMWISTKEIVAGTSSWYYNDTKGD